MQHREQEPLGRKALSTKGGITMESLPPANNGTDRSNSAANSRIINIDLSSLERTQVAQFLLTNRGARLYIANNKIPAKIPDKFGRNNHLYFMLSSTEPAYPQPCPRKGINKTRLLRLLFRRLLVVRQHG